jgi:probable phosphoglycerate mutase
MEIYIVRHGETVWNEQGLLQGSADIELNEKGRILAGKTGEGLENVYFDKIYSSPLIRAYETANLIRGHRNIQIIRDDRLRELSFGSNEGKDSEIIRTDENNPFHNFFARPELYVPPEDGETLEHICKRAKEFLEEVIEPQADKLERVMLVAHGAMNQALLCHIKNHDVSKYWAGGLKKNCGVIIVRLDEEGYCVLEESTVFYDEN